MTITSAADTDEPSPSATRRGEPRSQTIAQTIRQLFRAAKAFAHRAEEPAPTPRRRRSGETGKAFTRAGKAALRRVVRPPVNIYVKAAVSLGNTLNWLTLWQDNENNEQWIDNDFNAKQDDYFPQP